MLIGGRQTDCHKTGFKTIFPQIRVLNARQISQIFSNNKPVETTKRTEPVAFGSNRKSLDGGAGKSPAWTPVTSASPNKPKPPTNH